MSKKLLFSVGIIISFVLLITGITTSKVDAKYVTQELDSKVHSLIGGGMFAGWPQYNSKRENKITGYKGISTRIGYAQKTYFDPGIKTEQFNPYWEFGTSGIFLPYVGESIILSLLVRTASG